MLFREDKNVSCELSVCVSLYNYAKFIVAALDSVQQQTLANFNLVVVDDGSKDGSESVACHWLQDNADRFCSVLLARHVCNQGLPITRNTAIDISTTEYCFFLDADNVLYPRCLEQCLAAATETSAAVVYPLLEVFGNCHRLLNTDPWNPQRFARQNYVDAMALVCRQALFAVDGYSVMTMTGWEDYDLWCKLIESGFQGTRVPEILARYRSHGESMLHTVTNQPRNYKKVIQEIQNRHPWISYQSTSNDFSERPAKPSWLRRLVRASCSPHRVVQDLRSACRKWLAQRRQRLPIKKCVAAERMVHLGWFDPVIYLKNHSDKSRAQAAPEQHFLETGFRDGSSIFSAEQANDFLRTAGQDPAGSGGADYLIHDIRVKRDDVPLLTFGVYTSSQCHFFFQEIRDLLVEGLRQCGHTAHALNETMERPSTITHDWIVAPHRFFRCPRKPAWVDLRFLQNATMLNTEPLHQIIPALPLLEQAAITLDMHPQSTAALRHLGIPAHFFPLGHINHYPSQDTKADLSGLRAWMTPQTLTCENDPGIETPFAERPVDLFFTGMVSDRSQTLLAEQAACFSRYHCFFHICSLDPSTTTPEEMNLAATMRVSRLSKILLHFHNDGSSYVDWRNMVMHGFWQKTLVVTEPCYELPGMQPGVHYLHCTPQESPELIDWLLNTNEGQTEADNIRRQGHATFSTRYALQNILEHFIANIILNKSPQADH